MECLALNLVAKSSPTSRKPIDLAKKIGDSLCLFHAADCALASAFANPLSSLANYSAVWEMSASKPRFRYWAMHAKNHHGVPFQALILRHPAKRHAFHPA